MNPCVTKLTESEDIYIQLASFILPKLCEFYEISYWTPPSYSLNSINDKSVDPHIRWKHDIMKMIIAFDEIANSGYSVNELKEKHHDAIKLFAENFFSFYI